MIGRALAAAMLCVAPAIARADSLILLGLSKHFTDKVHQEVNLGVGYERGAWSAALFRNSFGRPAAYVLYRAAELRLDDRLELRLQAGAAFGYERSKAIPVLLPVLAYRVSERYTVDLAVVPGGEIGKGRPVLTLQLRVGL